MTKPTLLEEKPICMAEVKEELAAIKKRDKEIGFRATKTEDYLNEFVTLSAKKAEEMRAKLDGLKISRLKEEFIIKIMDTMPLSLDEMRTLLQGYVITLSQEDMKKIVEVVKEFAK